ncbi:MAG: hypothetical protein U1E56_10670 [Bauldia sp.]
MTLAIERKHQAILDEVVGCGRVSGKADRIATQRRDKALQFPAIDCRARQSTVSSGTPKSRRPSPLVEAAKLAFRARDAEGRAIIPVQKKKIRRRPRPARGPCHAAYR